jgi:hypothetical protein
VAANTVISRKAADFSITPKHLVRRPRPAEPVALMKV